jgi:F0F1-type ATP synthase assembly protein I
MNADIYANLRMASWREALRVLAVQAFSIVVVAILATLIWNARVGLGAAIGAGIGVLANSYFAIALLGKPLLTGKPSDIRLNWIVKVVLTLSLLWIAMRAKIVPPPSLVAGLFATMVAQWLAVVLWLGKRR